MTLDVDVSVRSGSFQVQATFAADPGITALYGPSGSGKSVTIAAIAGLLRPHTGTIILNDEIIADASSGLHRRTQDRHLGMVFQHGVLLPHRSPLDNVALAIDYAIPRHQRREMALTWLDRVGAAHLAHAPTTALSGGEQQRVALARAFAGQPRLLLLDEPLSALDQPTRVELRQLIRRLVSEEGLITVLVTHDLADIAALASQVVLFEPGRTVGSHRLDQGSAVDGEIARLVGLTAPSGDPSIAHPPANDPKSI
jgi:molybdate transport system ATP-binding protein